MLWQSSAHFRQVDKMVSSRWHFTTDTTKRLVCRELPSVGSGLYSLEVATEGKLHEVASDCNRKGNEKVAVSWQNFGKVSRATLGSLTDQLHSREAGPSLTSPSLTEP